MSKLVLLTLPDPVADPEGFVAAYNANCDALEEFFENTVSRDGSAPNEIEVDLDFTDRASINGPFTYPPPTFLTSRPYPYSWDEALGLDFRPRPSVLWGIEDDALGLVFEIRGGTLVLPLRTYTNWPDEAIEFSNFEVLEGTLDTVLRIYDEWPDEAIEFSDFEVLSGTLENFLIVYNNWPDEAIELGFSVQGGTLV